MPALSATAAKRVNAREREHQAFELRKAGATYRQIGEKLEVSSTAAHKMVKKVLARLAVLTEQDAEDLRRMELERLDAMLLGIWQKARAGHEGAIDRVLRIGQRRAELLGLDAPKRSVVTAALSKASELSDDELAEIAANGKQHQPG